MKFTLWPFSFELRDDTHALFLLIAVVASIIAAGTVYYNVQALEVDREALSKGYVQAVRQGSQGTIWVKPEEVRK